MDTELNNCTVSRDRIAKVASSCFSGLLFLLLLAMSLSPVARAGLPSLYGDKFAHRGKTWPDVSDRTGMSPPTIVESRSEKAYMAQLDGFESSGGPYADNLAEPLLGLGRYHATRGDYDLAVSQLQRALHIVRLNEGLYSELQAPYVRELLDTIRLTGDLKALDERYDYFFRLYGHGQPPYTPLRVRAALEYLRWQREALRLSFDSGKNKRLLRLYQLNESLLMATWGSAVYSRENQWLLALSQIRNLYLVQSMVRPRVQISRELTGGPVRTGFPQEEIDFEQKRLETIQQGALSRGVALLQRYIDAPGGRADKSIESRARAVLELADWYQWNGSYRHASTQYAAVVGMLLKAGEEDLVSAWFGDPVELPDNGSFWQPPLAVPGEEPTLLTATYDVSPKGKVKNIVVEARQEDQGKVSRFKRELVKTRFRPRYNIEDGAPQPVYAKELSREYRLYD